MNTDAMPQINTDEIGFDFDGLTSQIIRCAFDVSNNFGYGFLEKVYENAMAYEFQKRGIPFQRQRRLEVVYEGVIIGEYCADLIVDHRVLIELKAARALEDIHFAQCLNYLRATSLPVCLLINFGTPRIKIKRFLNKPLSNATRESHDIVLP